VDGRSGRHRHFLATCGGEPHRGERDRIRRQEPRRLVDVAVRNANDIAARVKLRSTLRSRIAETDFGDPIRYTRAVERHYRAMWHTWCDTETRGTT
jgi:hypothetical protein